MIDLRRSLTEPLRPRLAAVLRDDDTLVAGERDNFGIVRVDEDVLVVVAAWSSAQAVPGLAGVGRLPGNDAGYIDYVWIFGSTFGTGTSPPPIRASGRGSFTGAWIHFTPPSSDR